MTIHSSNEPRDSDEELWRLLAAASSEKEFEIECARFMQRAREPYGQIRKRLRGSVPDIFTALGVLKIGDDVLRENFFDEILYRCKSLRFGRFARSIVLSMPRSWVIANVEAAADKLLATADHLDFKLFLMLYEILDSQLALRLAKRAAVHDDFDIKETGVDFLQKVGQVL